MLVTAILVVNNLRDVDTDRKAGKRTLAVRLGREATQIQYTVLVLGAYLITPLMWLAGAATAWAMLPWLTIPLGYRAGSRRLAGCRARRSTSLCGKPRGCIFALESCSPRA